MTILSKDFMLHVTLRQVVLTIETEVSSFLLLFFILSMHFSGDVLRYTETILKVELSIKNIFVFRGLLKCPCRKRMESSARGFARGLSDSVY